MKTEVFGTFGAVVTKVMTIMKEVAKPTPDGIIDWLLKPEAQVALRRACEVAWEALVRAYEDFVAEANKVLEWLGEVTVPATTEKFVAKDKFRLKENGGICSGFGSNFTDWFLSGDGKIEDPIAETTLHYAKLRKASVDGPIIAELGGEVKAETTLSEMFSLMEKQKNGEDGVLLNNGWANIFYIRDQNGILRAVSAHWYDDGWFVGADSVESPLGWLADRRVFSRKDKKIAA